MTTTINNINKHRIILYVFILNLSIFGYLESPSNPPTHTYPPSGTINGLHAPSNTKDNLSEDTSLIPITELQSIYDEFETALFKNIDAEIYIDGAIFFNALKILLLDVDLLYSANKLGTVPYLNIPSTIFIPSNESLLKYLSNKGYSSMDDFYVSNPDEFKSFILIHLVKYLYDYVGYFGTKRQKCSQENL